MIATGSEVSLAIETAEKLEQEGKSVRVVSMPCMDIFDRQDDAYRQSILPSNVRARVGVEAGSGLCMSKYIGLDGEVLCMDSFGESAPADLLFEKFGFTVDNLLEISKRVINR